MTIMAEKVFFRNRRPDRPATIEEYRQSGGYQALIEALRSRSPEDIHQAVQASGLRGRGGAGFPTGLKWKGISEKSPFPRYLALNTDEMEPGTFKDRVLVRADPHLIIEGMALSAYAISARTGYFFIRPSYELDAEIMEKELEAARNTGFLGPNILGSKFSFDIVVHRSAGRYICGEASAMINALMGNRAHPIKIRGVHLTEQGLWNHPTIVNNTETIACVPSIVRNGPDWFRSLAANSSSAGTKLYCISGRVKNPGCYELPMGTPLQEIIDEAAGGMAANSELKAFMPGGASTAILPPKFRNVSMDWESWKKAGHRLGTGAIMIFDQNTCLVGAALNLMDFFGRESCGFCTPCREGLPYIRDMLWRIEHGQGREEYLTMLYEMAKLMDYSYCAFAPGAAEPVLGLLSYFKDEILEHITQKKCPFGAVSTD